MLGSDREEEIGSARIHDDLSLRGKATTISPAREWPIEIRRDSEMRFISNAVLFLRICAFAAAVPYLLKLNLSRVASALEPGKDPRAVDENRVGKITAYVEKAIRRGKPMVRPGCLTRGLTRYYFLRRAGMDIALCFGMGRMDNEFVGHCWLVKDGEPYLEPPDQDPRNRYTEMYRISRTTSPASAPNGVVARFSGL